MLLGYARISKNDGTQVFDLQMDALIKAGVSKEHIYTDEASGAAEERDGLQNCMKALRKEDTLVIWKLDRLSRRMRHLIRIIDFLLEKGINLKILSGQGANLDMNTPAGRMFFGLFATFAEFERELIVERTKAGLSAARARGRVGGRPNKITKEMLQIMMTQMADRNTSAGGLARSLGITTMTLYRYVNSDGTLKEYGKKLMEKSDK